MKIYLGTDHAGFELKEKLKEFLEKEGHDVEDLGAFEFDPHDDYPDFIYAVANKVAHTPGSFGVVLGGSGQGECMVANKVKGVQAAIGYSDYAAKMSRLDNDANVLCLPARVLNEEEAKKIIQTWLETEFSAADRHVRRIVKMKEIEEKNFR